MEDRDYEVWSTWAGRSSSSWDVLNPAHVRRVAATLDWHAAPAEREPLPELWHWAFFSDAAATETLGEDGHPPRGEFIPPVDLPSRMWAGSRLNFIHPLRVGDEVARKSTIAKVELKKGRGGPLVFVIVHHEYRVGTRVALEEEQDLVYRTPVPVSRRDVASEPDAQWTRDVTPSAALLFRYSAVTFNAHRIHYDHPYSTTSEGYSGLVVQGPLIATLMCQEFVRHNPGSLVGRFRFRGLRPLIASSSFRVGGRLKDRQNAEVWAADCEGLVSHGHIEYS